MKNILLLCVFVCVFVASVTGTPQRQQTNKPDYVHPLAEFSKKYRLTYPDPIQSMFKSNESFALESVEYQGWNGTEFVSYYLADYVYESGNRIETRHLYTSDDFGDWEVDARDLFVFSKDNRLMSETNQIVINEQFENDYRTLYTYQQTGGEVLLFTTVTQYWNADISGWENEERVQFTTINGILSGGETSSWNGSAWMIYERFLLEEHGDELYLTYQNFTGSDWMNTDRQVFKNLSINEMYLLFTEDIYTIENGSLLSLAEFFPDYTEQTWTGEEWVDISRQVTVTEYEWPGEISGKTIFGQMFETEWVTFSEIRLTFQDNRPSRLVLYTADDAEAMALTPDFSEDFEYNESGQLMYVIQKQATGVMKQALASSELATVGRIILTWSGASTSIGDGTTPVNFGLGNAYPNPFNPATVIPFRLGTSGDISIKVFDMLGRDVVTLVNGVYPAGSHKVQFDASGLSSGVYMVRLDTPSYQETHRVTLLK